MSPEAIAAAAELPPKLVSHLWPRPAVIYNNTLVIKLGGVRGGGGGRVGAHKGIGSQFQRFIAGGTTFLMKLR